MGAAGRPPSAEECVCFLELCWQSFLRNSLQTNKKATEEPGSWEPREALGSRVGSAKASVIATGHHRSACPWQQLWGWAWVVVVGRTVPSSRWGKQRLRDEMVPRPELSLSSEYAFPTLVSLPWEGWEYGESGNMVKVMDPLLKKKKRKVFTSQCPV